MDAPRREGGRSRAPPAIGNTSHHSSDSSRGGNAQLHQSPALAVAVRAAVGLRSRECEVAPLPLLLQPRVSGGSYLLGDFSVSAFPAFSSFETNSLYHLCLYLAHFCLGDQTLTNTAAREPENVVRGGGGSWGPDHSSSSYETIRRLDFMLRAMETHARC